MKFFDLLTDFLKCFNQLFLNQKLVEFSWKEIDTIRYHMIQYLCWILSSNCLNDYFLFRFHIHQSSRLSSSAELFFLKIISGHWGSTWGPKQQPIRSQAKRRCWKFSGQRRLFQRVSFLTVIRLRWRFDLKSPTSGKN